MSHPTFELLRRQPIESLGVSVEEYRHTKTGAQHIHIDADNPENAFLVALRTVPHDSTGVAHILEHTALCGSKRYPVRDPFFMMIRRSLNTFMNAFTSSDWTAYPFASANKKDFCNLLDVYLDAVFFPNLDPLDFAQEGHRLEFKDPANPDSGLEFKGVVFNEMKGAMSSESSILWQTLSKYLFPSTTYHFNSGGEPADIPDLSYEDLVDFHRSHYHPSNSIFMTFGNIPAAEHQARFEERVLGDFTRLDHEIGVPREKRYFAPLRVEESYGVEDKEAEQEKTHILLGWLLGDSTDLYQSMKAHLLSSVLMDNSASPLQKALETTELGKAPSPLCGLEDSQRELIFVCGLEGSEVERADKVEALILDTIRQVAENGIEHDQVEACLHQIELQQREITGDGFPYGLHLILTALNNATHRGDPVALLDLDPVLKRLREEIRDPQFIPQLCQELLLNNTHRVRLVMRPDSQFDGRKEEAEQQRLREIESNLDATQKGLIVEQAEALQQRQNQADNPELLPKVTLEDVQPEMNYTPVHSRIETPLPLTRYAAGTNGLVYQQIVIDLPELSSEELSMLPLLTHLLTEVGVGSRDYLAVQQWQAATCGGLNCTYSIRGAADNLQSVRGYLTLSTKALLRNQSEVSELIDKTLENARFDEIQRIQEIVTQARMRAQSSITQSGHSLAMTAAAQHFSPAAQLAHQSGGLAGISGLIKLDETLKSETELSEFSQQLSALHARLKDMPRQLLLICEEEWIENSSESWMAGQQSAAQSGAATFSLSPTSPRPANELWTTHSQVNFCSRAYPTVPMHHPDAAALTALGGYLRNNFLHRAIREQGGAYGGGASQDSNQGAFRFYSYRDPRMSETLDDFDRSIAWMLENKPKESLIEESVLGVIASIDKPASPAGEARQTFSAELHGRTREIREQFRNNVLKVTGEDLQRVASTYLLDEQASTAIVTDSSRSEKAAELSLDLKPLQVVQS